MQRKDTETSIRHTGGGRCPGTWALETFDGYRPRIQSVAGSYWEWSRKLTRREVTELLTDVGFSMGMAQTITDLADCPYLEARGMFVETGNTMGGRFRTLKAPIRLTGCVEPPSITPPRLGEHNREILCDIGGLSLDGLTALEEQGAI